MSDLEVRYRRALRWYPRKWRATNEDAMVGTLLDQCDAEHRTEPAPGELANLRLSGAAACVGVLGRIYPTEVRNRASLLCLGLAAAISVSAIVQTVVVAVLYASARDSDPTNDASTFGALSTAGIAVYVLWLAALVATLVGLRRISRWLVVATLPASVALRVLEDHVPQVLWTSTVTICVLGVLAIIVAAGTPGGVRRGRMTVAATFGMSMLGTAAVGLWNNGSPFNQGPIFVVEYLFGGGRGFTLLGQDQLILEDRDILLRPFDTWFVIAIPLVIIGAGILNRLRKASWAGGALVLLIPMAATLLFVGPGAPDFLTTLGAFALVAAAVAVILGLLRFFGVRIRMTRV
jgi:hypothetical protein